MIERHLMKLRARDEVTPEEEQAIRSIVRELRHVRADTRLIRAGEVLSESTMLLDGIACRYKDLRNGERQITELHVAGDFLDLHSFTLKRLDHDVLALTRCTIAVVAHDDLRRITDDHPHLTRLYWFGTNLDAAIHREWELSLGRRTAAARIAHLLCELYVRLGLVGLTDGFSYRLGLTQTDLAECLGLTSVHVNRMLKELREGGLVAIRDGMVDIEDWEGLQKRAEFTPDYLYLERRPR
ncbi:Crp/Fnr family transcriptional regulator [Sphingosinicella terrae]|jgi:CRP-like cAMP-binding protein|uniref:Crp/Fnr family transcriptional regulator n=1 Tax=Sphingosinicella terrae TaxID=2172047 RepID=UPI000E0D6ED1|nr:Crp/Fnr family transcriptional regulator [Sphingosinicella terrae]